MRTSNLGFLIAVLSLPILSLTAGHYLPYVIVAVSGSGVIAVVPLVTFAVSTVVALISVAYLVKLAVSRADNKKEAGSGKEEPDRQAKPTKELAEEFAKKLVEELNRLLSQPCSVSQESTEKSVHKNTNRPSMFTPTPPPVTLGAQPPTPPPLPKDAVPLRSSFSQNLPTQPGGTNTELENTKPKGASGGVDPSDMFEEIRKGAKLKKVDQNQLEAAKKPSGDNREIMLAQIRKGVELKPVEPKDAQQQQLNATDDMASILARRPAMEPSDSESEGKHENGVSDSEWEENDEHSTSTIPQQVKPKKDEQQSNVTGYMASILVRRVPEEFSNSESEDKHENGVSDSKLEEDDEHSTSTIPQSDNEKRSESPDSGNVSEDDVNQQKSKTAAPTDQSSAKEPLILPGEHLATSSPEPQAPPATTVNDIISSAEGKNPHIPSSVKDQIAKFGGSTSRASLFNHLHSRQTMMRGRGC